VSSGNTVIDPAAVKQMVREAIPHVKELGAEVVAIEKDALTIKLDYQQRLVGNPETGVLHGGLITTLIDTVCGIAVYIALPKIVPIATLDLRIDYLKPATPGKTLVARGHCYKVTSNVAFARAIAFHDDPDEPIANSVSTFMLDTARGRPRGRRA
jgi:uncharacterized protein (TIGR00369 family)